MCERRMRVGPSVLFFIWVCVDMAVGIYVCVCVCLDSVGRLCTSVYGWVLGLCSGEFVVHLCALVFFEVGVCVGVCWYLRVLVCVWTYVCVYAGFIWLIGVCACVCVCVCVCFDIDIYIYYICFIVCVAFLYSMYISIWWCSPCVGTFFDGCVCPQGLGFVWLSYMWTWGWYDVDACMYMHRDYFKLVGFLLLCLFFGFQLFL
ncbi:unnamed protein product [Gadus morhua 'NCC']